jgi:hypothetical protein
MFLGLHVPSHITGTTSALLLTITKRHMTTSYMIYGAHTVRVNDVKMQERIESRRGEGGTEPRCIAEEIKNGDLHTETCIESQREIVIISDGQCNSTKEIDIILADSMFPNVDVHLIRTDGVVNMSISCAFTRKSPHTVRLYEQHLVEPVVTTQVTSYDLSLLDQLTNINTLEEFNNQYDSIYRAIVARTMGTQGDHTLRFNILDLQRRIIANNSKEKSMLPTPKLLEEALINPSDPSDSDTAIRYMRELTNIYYGITDVECTDSLSVKVSKLLAMCEGGLHKVFSMDEVSRISRAKTVYMPDINTVPPAPEESCVNNDFTCPISMDPDDITLLIKDGPGIFNDVDANMIQALINCPLTIFSKPFEPVLQAFIARVDHPIGLSVLKEAKSCGHAIEFSPLTRVPVLPLGVCLGSCETHCAASRSVFAHILTGSTGKGKERRDGTPR